MPLYTQQSLELVGTRPIYNQDLCFDDGIEDFANSENSGRWVGSAFTARWSVKDIAGDLGWTGEGVFLADIITLPSSPKWGLLILDAVLQSKVAATGAAGLYNLSLGTNESGLWDNVFPGGGPHDSDGTVHTDIVTLGGGYFGTAAGRGGRLLTSTYNLLKLRWNASGFTLASGSTLALSVLGYLVPDGTASGA